MEAQNAAATFGVFGKSAGLAGQDQADFSTGMAKLAVDMASFSNTTPEQAIEALSAGLRGESEPLRPYGVLLDDASLRQEALAMGLITTTNDALTPQQKVLASQSLIMKQTSYAQGDFERTSGGLANQQRILTASWTDAKGALGQAFLPMVQSAVSTLNEKMMPAITTAIAVFKDFWSGLSSDPSQREGLSDIALKGAAIRDSFMDAWPSIKETGAALLATGAAIGTGAWDVFLAVVQALAEPLKSFANFLKDNPPAVYAPVGAFAAWKTVMLATAVATAAVPLAVGLATAAQWLWNVALGAGAVAMTVLTSPITLIVVAIAALAAGVIYAYTRRLVQEHCSGRVGCHPERDQLRVEQRHQAGVRCYCRGYPRHH